MDTPEKLASHILTCSLKTLQDAQAALTQPTAAGAFARGQVLELAGHFEPAIESYLHALSMDQQQHTAMARLALVQLKNGDYEKGLATAMNLAACHPSLTIQTLATDETVGAMSILGDALVLNGRLEDAAAAYEAARKHNGSDTYAAGRLAQLYLTLHQPEKVVKLRSEFASNSRFSQLASVAKLADTSSALLPSYTQEQLIGKLSKAVAGRPLIAENCSRQAEMVRRDDGWCVDLQ